MTESVLVSLLGRRARDWAAVLAGAPLCRASFPMELPVGEIGVQRSGALVRARGSRC